MDSRERRAGQYATRRVDHRAAECGFLREGESRQDQGGRQTREAAGRPVGPLKSSLRQRFTLEKKNQDDAVEPRIPIPYAPDEGFA